MSATDEMELQTVTSYRRDRGKYHEYYVDGERVKGVTTLINAGLPKNLAKWGSEATANKAIDEWAKLARMPVSARLKALTAAPWESMNRAAIRGTMVHGLAERLVNGETVTVPEDVRGYVQACRSFLKDWQVTPLHVELALYSRKHKYGGTADLIATTADGGPYLYDYKTSASGIWGSTAFQVTAYRFSDFYLDEDGKEQPIPEVKGCRGVHLMEDGSYEVYPLESDRHVFRQFLAIAQVAQAADDEKEYVGNSLGVPVEVK